jgi:dihydrofolate reductase
MIVLIAAVDKNFCIGKGGAIPWYLPRDFAHFKKTTMGHPIIMGRKTFESIGRPLPGRTNIVLTDSESIAGVQTAHSLVEALDKARAQDTEIYGIGGASVYTQMLPSADRIVLTHVAMVVDGGDVFFPHIDKSKWQAISSEYFRADQKNAYDCTIVTYERKT